ncbi:hypothetical protein MMAGJ_30080 [Mycolicibacterium mageritense]|uniref:acetolactate synthase n=1 Tax=Mycolicibacterium mageritense TaxID=53462 RepID=A0ABM7HT35_MYCME|nr:hypothetical protein MMAGJ_30080 [Mycolicibacterium mageritense]
MTMRSGGQALVDALVAHGVDTVFGIPGTHNLAAFAALAASPIRTVLTRHEQGAGYAADGYARVAGRPGVCLTTTGPAILNALAAAAQAWSDSVPVLFISPGMSTGHPGRGNGLLHEVKDQHAAVEAVVAYSHRVGSVAEIPLAVTYAFSAMTTGRPRPVHIEIPLDLLDAEAEVHIVAPVAPRPVEPDTAALADAAARLAVAAEPVLIVGGGAKGAATQVRTVAEHLDAPVLMTANGKGVLDEAHPLAVGSGVHHPAARALLVSADAVLAIGTELAPSDFWYGPVDLGDKLIRVDVDAAAMVTNADPAVRLLGDASATLALLAGALPAIAAGTSRAVPRARPRLASGCAPTLPPRAGHGSTSWRRWRPPSTCARSSRPTATWRRITVRCPTFRYTGRPDSSTPPASAPWATGCPRRSARPWPKQTRGSWRSWVTAASCSPCRSWPPPHSRVWRCRSSWWTTAATARSATRWTTAASP